MDALEKSEKLLYSPGEPELLFPYTKDKISGEMILESYIPSIHRLLPYLLSTSIKYKMDPYWDERPDYASYDIYGTTNWWWLILYLNKVESIFDFNHNKLSHIYAPSKNKLRMAIFKLNS